VHSSIRASARTGPARLVARAIGALLLVASAATFAAEPLLLTATRKATGDLDDMLARREVRALVAHSRTEYEVVKGKQTGIVYEGLTDLERDLNEDFAPAVETRKKAKRRLFIRVTIVAVPYDQLYRRLEAGYGDFIASPMLVTRAAAQQVDFTTPFFAEAKEVMVTHKGDVLGEGIEAFSGRTVHVRRSSGFYQSLLELNERLGAAGKLPAKLVPVDEHLSDDELLEMVNAGLIPATVTYRFRASLWSHLFSNIEVNDHNVLLDHGKIAWAVRKDSPKLRAYLDRFVEKDNATGIARRKRYLVDTRFARHALDSDGQARFEALVGLFQRYAEQYSFDHLLLMAQGYQESRLDHSARSPVGAIGIMQVMPETGRSLKVGDIQQLEPNIHAGTKYLDILRRKYFDDPEIDPIDRTYFSFAAYNAGPGNIHRMRTLAEKHGLNPNVWFDNVELVTLQHIGREPVQYVSNISKYYLAYRLYMDNVRLRPAPPSPATRAAPPPSGAG